MSLKAIWNIWRNSKPQLLISINKTDGEMAELSFSYNSKFLDDIKKMGYDDPDPEEQVRKFVFSLTAPELFNSYLEDLPPQATGHPELQDEVAENGNRIKR